MPDLIEDADGAPLPPELQRDSAIWYRIRDSAMLPYPDDIATEIADGACEELAPLLWPLLPSNDHGAPAKVARALEELKGRHFWRDGFQVRSESCKDGLNSQGFVCEETNDPACSESCFAYIRICNGCGTQDSCSYTSLIAMLERTPE